MVEACFKRVKRQRTPRFSMLAARVSAMASSPSTLQCTPRLARFTATLPAPPGRFGITHVYHTGTGASGEMRVAPNQ